MELVKSRCVLQSCLVLSLSMFYYVTFLLLIPITGYGMTEMLATHMQPRGGTKPGSVGVLMANLECKVKVFYMYKNYFPFQP